MVEYRVRWQRVGKRKKVKIYQTLQGAKDFITILTDGCYYNNSESERLYNEIPELIEDPVLETRPVGIWTLKGNDL